MAAQEEKRRKSSIFRKVFSRLFLAGLLPLFAIAVAGASLLYFSYRQTNEIFEQTVLAQKKAEVERFVRETLESFEVIVNYPERLPLEVKEETFPRFLLEGLLRDNAELVEIALVQSLEGQKEAVGAETIRLVRNTGESTVRLRANDGLFLIAREGKAAIGGVTWTENIAVVDLASPVKNSQGEIIGVLMGKLRLTKLQQLFQTAGFGETGTIFVYDEAGRVLAHSGGPALLRKEVEREALHDAAFRSVITDKGLSGERALLASLPTVSPKWTFVAEWPFRDAFAALWTLLAQIGMVGGLLSATLLLFARTQASEIVRPIRAIQQEAVRIGKGEFWKAVAVKTGDELEDLSDSLTAMAHDLARLQEVRATEIRAQALTQAIEKEEALTEAKDVLLSTASHQFRTPVSVLNWNISLLKTMSLPKEALELLEGVAEHSQNLSAIAGDLLNATAFGAGYEPELAQFRPLVLNAILREVVDRMNPQAKKKQVTITFSVAPTDGETSVAGIYGALRILFDNLLDNAVTYTQANGSIVVSFPQGREDTIHVSIRDNGIGIPADDQEHLFTAFFRAKNAIVAKNVGTGLGLYIARNIAVGHGGTIRFTSQEGKGSEFVVILPKQLPNTKKQDTNKSQ